MKKYYFATLISLLLLFAVYIFKANIMRISFNEDNKESLLESNSVSSSRGSAFDETNSAKGMIGKTSNLKRVPSKTGNDKAGGVKQTRTKPDSSKHLTRSDFINSSDARKQLMLADLRRIGPMYGHLYESLHLDSDQLDKLRNLGVILEIDLLVAFTNAEADGIPTDKIGDADLISYPIYKQFVDDASNFLNVDQCLKLSQFCETIRRQSFLTGISVSLRGSGNELSDSQWDNLINVLNFSTIDSEKYPVVSGAAKAMAREILNEQQYEAFNNYCDMKNMEHEAALDLQK